MNKISLGLIAVVFSLTSYGQNNKYDSLKSLVASAKDESTKLTFLTGLVWVSMWSFPDSALAYLPEEIRLANQLKSDAALSVAYTQYGVVSYIKGNFSDAISLVLEGLKLAEKSQRVDLIGTACGYLSEIYAVAGDFKHALEYHDKFKSYYNNYLSLQPHGFPHSAEDSSIIHANMFNTFNLSRTYEKFNRLDSAIRYLEQGYNDYNKYFGKPELSIFPQVFGNIYFKKGDYQKALEYYQSALRLALGYDIKKEIMEDLNGIAKSLYQLGKTDSCLYYAQKVIEQSQFVQFPVAKLEALAFIASLYKASGNVDSTNKYLELSIATKDSMFSQQKIMQLQSITFNEQLRVQNIEDEKQAFKEKVKTYLLISGLGVFLIISLILANHSRQRQKAKINIEKAYNDLKATQAQLVQSEKMASLGELTAGIAHEIQNPLNFVNNFSEVNKELLEEAKGKRQEAKENSPEVGELLDDIERNLEKVSHHGKRADAIVKGMLQHSRTNSGEKEPTDINALAEEYLRLAYQGMRAKNKTFNTQFSTSFDPALSADEAGIGKVNIVPQDIGRVLLNLYNNAFYAVSTRSGRDAMHGVSTNEGYHPQVSVTTVKKGNHIEITVKDNGIGIPQKIADKIFQPFFTTKPTGQGTGLGLSLSYDIVKAHGGEITVNSIEGQGSEFSVILNIG